MINYSLLKVYLFIWDRKRPCEWGSGTEIGRERERTPRILCAVSTEPNVEFELCDIMIWAETKSWMLNRLSHPVAPKWSIILIRIQVQFIDKMTFMIYHGKLDSTRIIFENENISIKNSHFIHKIPLTNNYCYMWLSLLADLLAKIFSKYFLNILDCSLE